MRHLIYCKGRWSIGKSKIDCEDKFEYVGEFGDKELVDHMNKEKATDSKHDWWTGFDTDEKFENMRSKVTDGRKG